MNPVASSLSYDLSDILRHAELDVDDGPGSPIASGLPTDRTSKVVGNEGVDDLRAQTGPAGLGPALVGLGAVTVAIVLDDHIQIVAAPSHGNRDMALRAPLEPMLDGIVDQLGQDQGERSGILGRHHAELAYV